MGNATDYLSRLRLLAEIDAKLTLLEQLQDRVLARLKQATLLYQRYVDNRIPTMAALKNHVQQIEGLGKRMDDVQSQRATIAKKLQKVMPQINDSANTHVDRVLERSLYSLEQLQSLLEVQLLEIDGLVEELEGAVKVTPRN